jgi:hypothetical protein
MPKRDMAWWFWLATDVLLALALFVDRRAIAAVIALASLQVAVFVRRGGFTSFPAQVRIAYLALLILGLWPPLRFIQWVQLVGTTAMVLCGYCFLARCLSLLPFNRAEPLTPAMVRRTFFSRPTAHSILGGASVVSR